MRTKAGVITDKNENIILDVDFIMYYNGRTMLFKYNTYLQDVSSIFEDTEVIVGTDISENLFKFNTRLRNISRMWANCTFNGSEYLSDGRDNTQTYTQIPFEKIFQYNTSISNASGLFSVGIIDSNVIYGLRLIEDTLLKTVKIM